MSAEKNAQVHYDLVIKKNGKRAALNDIHCFTLEDGRITRWVGLEDTAQVKALWNA